MFRWTLCGRLWWRFLHGSGVPGLWALSCRLSYLRRTTIWWLWLLQGGLKAEGWAVLRQKTIHFVLWETLCQRYVKRSLDIQINLLPGCFTKCLWILSLMSKPVLVSLYLTLFSLHFACLQYDIIDFPNWFTWVCVCSALHSWGGLRAVSPFLQDLLCSL